MNFLGTHPESTHIMHRDWRTVVPFQEAIMIYVA